MNKTPNRVTQGNGNPFFLKSGKASPLAKTQGEKLLKHLSPLRYPGGEAFLSEFLADVIDLNNLRGCVYFEPYAGGAGAALKLLNAGVVSEIRLNDADPESMPSGVRHLSTPSVLRKK